MEGIIEFFISMATIYAIFAGLLKKVKRNSWSKTKGSLPNAQHKPKEVQKSSIVRNSKNDDNMNPSISDVTASDQLSSSFVSMEEISADDFFSQSRIVRSEAELLHGVGGLSSKNQTENTPQNLSQNKPWMPNAVPPSEALVNAIIMSEVLGKPKALRKKR